MTLLASLMASISKCESALVLYILTPLTIMSLASPVFRQVCSAIKRTLQGRADSMTHVHFVPEQSVFGSPDSITLNQHAAELFCFSVYDRVLRPVNRYISRQISGQEPRIRSYFQETAFALARPVYTQVKFHRQNIVRALDVIDRHTLLHIGYQTSVCGKWILAAAVDERGEAHDLGVWLYDSANGEKGLVELIWGFVIQFGRRANIEWRIVIARLGEFGERELDGGQSSRPRIRMI
jgi:mediator of RNA polymerase II transcription subunit 13